MELHTTLIAGVAVLVVAGTLDQVLEGKPSTSTEIKKTQEGDTYTLQCYESEEPKANDVPSSPKPQDLSGITRMYFSDGKQECALIYEPKGESKKYLEGYQFLFKAPQAGAYYSLTCGIPPLPRRLHESSYNRSGLFYFFDSSNRGCIFTGFPKPETAFSEPTVENEK